MGKGSGLYLDIYLRYIMGSRSREGMKKKKKKKKLT